MPFSPRNFVSWEVSLDLLIRVVNVVWPQKTLLTTTAFAVIGPSRKTKGTQEQEHPLACRPTESRCRLYIARKGQDMKMQKTGNENVSAKSTNGSP
jgi:hypothetical protein